MSCDQLRVGEAPTDRERDQAFEALHGVDLHVAIVQAKRELAAVPAQMLRADVVVDTDQAALENVNPPAVQLSPASAK